MTVILVSSVIVLLLSWIISGLSIVVITATVSTLLFCARKFGYFCKFNTLLVIEVIGIILTGLLRSMFGDFNLLNMLLIVLVRAIFIGICYYDISQYVYVKERKRKDS